MDSLILKREIEARKEKKDEIKKAVNNYCEENYGIEGFFEVVDKIFSPSENEFEVCLARQVPTINIEHIGFNLLAQWLSQTTNIKVVERPLSFVSDQYTHKNGYKKSLVRLQWLCRGRKGPFVRYESITKPKAGQTLSDLRVRNNGQTIPEFHGELRRKVFGENNTLDLSLFFETLVKRCLESGSKNSPKHVYLLEKGYGLRVLSSQISKQEIDELNIRPPADWYYFFYQLLFVDGSRGLVSTIDDDPIVGSWFQKARLQIKDICNFIPLIIPAPKKVEKSEELLECPVAVFEKDWKNNIRLPPVKSSFPVFQAMEGFEKQAIDLV